MTDILIQAIIGLAFYALGLTVMYLFSVFVAEAVREGGPLLGLAVGVVYLVGVGVLVKWLFGWPQTPPREWRGKWDG